MSNSLKTNSKGLFVDAKPTKSIQKRTLRLCFIINQGIFGQNTRIACVNHINRWVFDHMTVLADLEVEGKKGEK